MVALEGRDTPSTVLYAHGFEPGTVPAKAAGVTAAWSHTKTSVTPAGNRSFRGDFDNQVVTLTLDKLPAHKALTVSFDVYVIRSWDGSDKLRKYGPETFLASLGDTNLVFTSFSNQPASSPGSKNNRQGYGGAGQTLGEFAAFAGASEVNTLGYDFFRNSTQQVEQMSSVYRVSTDVYHTASKAVVKFQGDGLQKLADESWGVDNVRVETAEIAPTLPVVQPDLTRNPESYNCAGLVFGTNRNMALEEVQAAASQFRKLDDPSAACLPGEIKLTLWTYHNRTRWCGGSRSGLPRSRPGVGSDLPPIS